MLAFDVSQQQRDQAHSMAQDMGDLGLGSILRGGGNIAGFIGEIVIRDYLGAKQDNTYQHDLIFHGLSLDVKTKRCSNAPRPDYDASIKNPGQSCDLYVFCRVLYNLEKCYCMGYITRRQYLKQADRKLKGDYDESNDFEFKASCYNLAYSELKPIERLKRPPLQAGPHRITR